MDTTVGILGTGMVGRALAGRLAEVGYTVHVGARSADSASLEPLAAMAGVATGSFADAAAAADIVVNATSGRHSVDVLTAAGADNLAGKPVIDVSNDLDPDRPGLLRVRATADDSVAKRLQEAFPTAHIVKSLNTMNNQVMVDPGAVPGDHVVFMSGDDAGTKDQVAALLQSLGWRSEQIVDLGGVDTAIGPEMAMALWLAVMFKRGWDAPPFNWALNAAE
jgi:predicted dinucleotide-binding enzyme